MPIKLNWTRLKSFAVDRCQRLKKDISEIKRLQDENKALEERNRALEEKNKVLEKRNGELLSSMNPEGGLTDVSASESDVTGSTETEKKLRDHYRDLEKKVKARTEELTHINEALVKVVRESQSAERKLRESEERFRKITGTVTDYIYTVYLENGQVKRTEYGPTCSTVTGYTADEFMSQPLLWIGIVPQEDQHIVLEQIDNIFSGREVKPIEHRITCKDGAIRWVSGRAVLHYDEQGKLVSYDGVIRDVTERKQSEELLKESTKQAELANKIKSQFLANMSHEIRTPMNAVIGFSELLEGTALDPLQKDYVGTIRESGQLLMTLINDILDISKIEAGEVRLEEIGFDLEYLVRSVIKMNSTKMQNKNVELIYVFDENIKSNFLGDPTRIRQILMNLLSNAIKFTVKGEITISVRSESTEDAGSGQKADTIRFSVKDTGIGIAKSKQEKLFMPFEQADASTTRKYGGTGLGLAISKAFVAMMGGKIWVESEEGKGSEFIFTLRLKEMESSAAKNILPVNLETLKGKKVLIVDDNENTKRILEICCKDAGMDVLNKLSSAEEALKWLSDSAAVPDIILSDVIMSGMSGYEFGKKISGKKELTHAKLIAVTSDIRPGAAQEAKKSGFHAYLPKPIIKSELFKVIQTVLGDGRESGQIVTKHMAEELSCVGLKILVAEDNIVNQKLLQLALKNIGCDVDIASNGQVAVEKVKINDYDLVLMDLQMPIMGGCEATKIIRDNITSTLPIIALTAAAMKEDEERSFTSGMNDYIAKPFEMSKLKEKIIKWAGTKEKR
ncbi:MAG: response regulator [Candidatus Omnitrophica bacterium]|nr:response regulator [Candidatus Omnitrophota bacterium]